MKVWITKYALTDGIFSEEGTICDSSRDSSMIEIRRPGRSCEYFHGEGKEWHRSEAVAAERAEIMRDAKMRSLEKQLERLRVLRFSVNGSEQ